MAGVSSDQKLEQKEAQKAPTLAATFVRDVNFPDGSRVFGGQTLIKEWEFSNPAGGLQWPEGSKLIFVRGDRELLGEMEEFPIPPAAPGQKVTVGVELFVPKKISGRRQAHFRFADAQRNVFGDRCWIEVEVVDGDEKDRKLELKEVPVAPVSAPVAAPAPAKPAPVEPAPVAPAPVAPAPVAPAPVRVEAPAAVPVPIPVKPEAKTEQPKPVEKSPPPQFKAHLEILSRLGFENQELNVHLLNKASGDLEQVINWLLDTKKYS